jgi:hypothetical protein
MLLHGVFHLKGMTLLAHSEVFFVHTFNKFGPSVIFRTFLPWLLRP